MKKVFVFLGVILLSFMSISCKEEIKYEEYEKSQELNERLYKIRYGNIYYIVPYLDNIDMLAEGRKFYKTYLGNDLGDYYICGYFDKSIIEIFENIGFYEESIDEYTIFGKNEYILMWNYAIRQKIISSEEFPIYWYKISKSEEVPESMNDKFLVAVLESVNVIYESLEDDEKFETEMLFENHDFYSVEKVLDRKKMFEKESFQMRSEENVNYLKEGFSLVENYFLTTLTSGKSIVYFNEIPCVTFGHYTIYHDEDLKDKYEYFNNEYGVPYFKLSDIMEMLGR